MIQNAAIAFSSSTSISKNRTIDTTETGPILWDSPNNSLENLAKHFNVKLEGIPHRAMTDVKMISKFQNIHALLQKISTKFWIFLNR